MTPIVHPSNQNQGSQMTKQQLDATRQKFHAWALGKGYDVAQTYNTDRSRWVWLNPMTADLWAAWLASAETMEPITPNQPSASAIMLAVMNGWLHPKVSDRTMDLDLAVAISEQVRGLFLATAAMPTRARSSTS